MVEIAPERIELLAPETLVAGHPSRGGLHGRGLELAAHHAPLLGARDEAGGFEHGEVLHEAGQRHAVRLGELGDGGGARAELLEHAAARGVGECGEHEVELVGLIVSHLV